MVHEQGARIFLRNNKEAQYREFSYSFDIWQGTESFLGFSEPCYFTALDFEYQNGPQMARHCHITRFIEYPLICNDKILVTDRVINSVLKKTGSSICRSELKSFAAILVGPIRYIEIQLGTAFFFDDCSNVISVM